MGSLQLLFSFGYWLFGIYMMAVAGTITDQIYLNYFCYAKQSGHFPLPDLFCSISKPISDAIQANNLSPYSFTDTLLLLLLVFFVLQLFTNKDLRGRRCLIASRFFLVWGTCCYFRAICLTTTVLPSYHSDICSVLTSRHDSYQNNSVFWSGLLHLAAPYTQFYPQADYMFSGHAAAATCLAIFCLFDVMDAGPLSRTKNTFISLLYPSVLFAISATRIHYTADILVGILVAVFCYISYLMLAEKSKSKHLVFPLNVVQWIEGQSLHIE